MVIVICDDEANEREKLRRLIISHPQYESSIEILTFASAEALFEQQTKIDLLFLDIELQGLNGIEAAKRISEQQPECVIVLVSNYWQYITEAYHTDVCQFLIKPLRQDIFEREFAFCLERYEKLQACYLRKCQEGMTSIKKSDVVYLESRKRIICAHMVDGEEHCYYGKLSAEAEFLKDSGFVQCQKAFIINMAYVKHITPTEIQTTATDQADQTITVPISREKKKYMESMLRKYLASMM